MRCKVENLSLIFISVLQGRFVHIFLLCDIVDPVITSLKNQRTCNPYQSLPITNDTINQWHNITNHLRPHHSHYQSRCELCFLPLWALDRSHHPDRAHLPRAGQHQPQISMADWHPERIFGCQDNMDSKKTDKTAPEICRLKDKRTTKDLWLVQTLVSCLFWKTPQLTA